MTGMVGVTGAAVQLSSTCTSLLEYIKKVKGRPSSVRSYEAQLQKISTLCRDITIDPLLHTPGVETATHSLLRLVNANDIRTLVKNKRLRLPFSFLSHERKITDASAALDQEASSLAQLIIHLRTQVTRPSQDAVIREIPSTIPVQPVNMTAPQPSSAITPPASRRSSLSLNPNKNHYQGQADTTTPRSANAALDAVNLAMKMSKASGAQVVALYNKSRGGHQYNGETIFDLNGNSANQSRKIQSEDTVLTYGSIAEGGDQYSGKQHIHGGVPSVELVGSNVFVLENEAVPGLVEGSLRTGEQFIGRTIRVDCSEFGNNHDHQEPGHQKAENQRAENQKPENQKPETY